MTLTFLGAARTVTGSKYLLDTGESRVLIDAGLFQGLKELRELNWKDLPVPASSLDAIVLTHAHLDHVGYLPRIVMQGFSGRVFCTAGTKDLCRIVLPDSGRIQEEDAANANRHGFSQAPAGVASVRRGRCLPCRVAAPAGRLRAANAGRRRGRGGLHRRRPPARLRLCARSRGRNDDPVWRRSGALRPAGVARSRHRRARRLSARRIHLWRPCARGRQRRRSACGGDSRHCRTRRQADHPRLRHRARRRAVVLDRPARGAEAHSGSGGLPRQPHGAGGARALYRAHQRARSGAAAGDARREGAVQRKRARAAAEAPHPGGARAPHVCVLHDAVPRHRVERRVEAAHAVTHAGDRHLVERDGDRRPCPAPLEGRAAESAQHRAARRLPGGGHARAAAARRLHVGQDPRSPGAGSRAHRSHRIDVGACGFGRNPALARGLQGATQADVSGARRAPGDGRPRRVDRREARLERPHAAPRTKWLHWSHEPAVFDGSGDGTCTCGKRRCGRQRQWRHSDHRTFASGGRRGGRAGAAGQEIPAGAGGRRGGGATVRRRVQSAATRAEAADLAPLRGGARRPRHLLRPALRPQPGDARCSRRDHHASAGHRRGDARRDHAATRSCSG